VNKNTLGLVTGFGTWMAFSESLRIRVGPEG